MSAPEQRLLTAGPLEWPLGLVHGARAVRLLVDRGVDVRWRVVGQGSHHEMLGFLRHELGLNDRIEIVIESPTPAVLDSQLAWATAVLDPSVRTGTEVSTAVASARGLPIATTDPAVAGSVARRDPAALADAIARLAPREAP